ncbi:MAG TPA: (4Fe-4S)-binding protein [Fimbriimonas sp.]
MEEPTIRYSNGEVTVLWKPHRCIHSGNCVRGLPAVFDVRRRPWVDAHAASTDEIVQQVSRCPSGALSCEWDGPEAE